MTEFNTGHEQEVPIELQMLRSLKSVIDTYPVSTDVVRVDAHNDLESIDKLATPRPDLVYRDLHSLDTVAGWYIAYDKKREREEYRKEYTVALFGLPDEAGDRVTDWFSVDAATGEITDHSLQTSYAVEFIEAAAEKAKDEFTVALRGIMQAIRPGLTLDTDLPETFRNELKNVLDDEHEVVSDRATIDRIKPDLLKRLQDRIQ